SEAEDYRAAFRPETKALYVEVIGNPSGEIADLEALADLAHEHGVPLVVDATLATPYLVRPIEHGADIVIHSATKFLGGHGPTLAGVLIDSGNFDYGAPPERFPGFNEPDEPYTGLGFARAPGPDGARSAYGSP